MDNQYNNGVNFQEVSLTCPHFPKNIFKLLVGWQILENIFLDDIVPITLRKFLDQILKYFPAQKGKILKDSTNWILLVSFQQYPHRLMAEKYKTEGKGWKDYQERLDTLDSNRPLDSILSYFLYDHIKQRKREFYLFLIFY